MPFESGRRKNSFASISKKAIVYFLICLSCEPAFADGVLAECARPDKIESLDILRDCYRSRDFRDGALLRVVQLSENSESKVREIESFIKDFAPFSLRARTTLLDLYLESGAFSLASIQLSAIERLDSGYLSHEAKAGYLVRAGRYKEARKILKEILSDQPANLRARRLSAVVSYELENYPQAIRDLQYLIDPKAPSAVLELALVKSKFKNGDRKGASERLRACELCRALDEPGLSFEIGRVAEMVGDLVLAESAYRASLDRDARPAIRLSKILEKRGKQGEAIEVLKVALKTHEGDDRVLQALANLYVKGGKIAAAGEFLEEVSERFPEKKWAVEKLAQAQSLVGGSGPGVRVVVEEMPQAQSQKREPAAAGWRFVNVKPGDSLMSLSYRVFGTHKKWKKLYGWNSEWLQGPDSLLPGMKLRVPQLLPKGGQE